MKTPNKWEQGRDYIAWAVRSGQGARNSHHIAPRLSEAQNPPVPIAPVASDLYVPYLAPINNPYPLAGMCLVWLGPLDAGGYGYYRSQKVHRWAYQQTRPATESPPSVNHMCHLPFCFQPAHLYSGDHASNAADRQAYLSPMHSFKNWPGIDLAWSRAFEAGTHLWKPAEQKQLIPPAITDESPHSCQYAAPVDGIGDNRLCIFCQSTEWPSLLDQDPYGP